MHTDPSLIYSIHFTQCRKPWNCIGEGHSGGRVPGGPPATHIDTDAGDLEHCLELLQKWHELRSDLEKEIHDLAQDKTVLDGMAGRYKSDIFQGHCLGQGGSNYTRIQGLPATFGRMQELYV